MPSSTERLAMRAIAFQQFGGADRLERIDLPRPRAARGEILVRVVSAGVNDLDWKVREGRLADRIPHRFPVVPGVDVAGVVEELGEGASGFRKGDRVWALVRRPVIGLGCYAEYVTLPESSAALMPVKLLYEEAAGVPLAALAAWQQLFEGGRTLAGKGVLVRRAASGVGHFAVQLAKAAGARVVAACAPDDRAFVGQLGAEATIDESDGPLDEALSRVAGQGVELVVEAEIDELAVEPSAERLRELARRFDQKKLRVHVARILPLTEAAAAQTECQAGTARGKLVLNL
jgi:NADPH2:quinone reductase